MAFLRGCSGQVMKAFWKSRMNAPMQQYVSIPCPQSQNSGSSIIAEDLQHLCARLGIKVKGQSSRRKLLELLTEHVYPDGHEEKLVEIEATASDRQVSIGNALDDDYVKVLDELTCHDKDFTVDVGTMQEKSKFNVARMMRLVAPAAKCEQSAVF